MGKPITFQELSKLPEVDIQELCRGRPAVIFLRDFVEIFGIAGRLETLKRHDGCIKAVIKSSKSGENGENKNANTEGNEGELPERTIEISQRMSLRIIEGSP